MLSVLGGKAKIRGSGGLGGSGLRRLIFPLSFERTDLIHDLKGQKRQQSLFVVLFGPGQKLAITCDSVWRLLACTCDGLR